MMQIVALKETSNHEQVVPDSHISKDVPGILLDKPETLTVSLKVQRTGETLASESLTWDKNPSVWISSDWPEATEEGCQLRS